MARVVRRQLALGDAVNPARSRARHDARLPLATGTKIVVASRQAAQQAATNAAIMAAPRP
jgi:hypothetical protein